MYTPFVLSEARAMFIDAYLSGYITFDEAAPIADYFAELEAAQIGYISF